MYTQLRLSALEKGKKVALKELGVEPITMMADITQPLILSEKYDIALLWGLAIPHFSPWKWVRVLVNILNILVDDGLFMYDEGDRVYNTFIIRGFREIILQVVEENRVVLDIFADRNSRTGDIKKLYVDFITRERATINLYYWDMASSAAFTWIFFEDVGFMPIRSSCVGAVLAYRPRRVIKPGDFIVKNPTIVQLDKGSVA